MKRFVTQLASVIRKTYHGIVILAELEGQIVGYLLAWEIMPHCRDPYKHQTLTGKPHGKDIVNWQFLSSQVNNACDQVQEELGALLCEAFTAPRMRYVADFTVRCR